MASTAVASRRETQSPARLMPVLLAASAPYVIAGLVSLLVFFSLFHLWGADLRIPITAPGGDYWFEGMVVKAIVETGWYFEMPRIGAPGTSHLYDFPMAEGLHAATIKLLGFICRDFSLTLNVFYILGYAFSSMTALALFRSLALPLVPSIAGGLLYAFIPQHYLPAEYHLFLSAYYMVPLMVMVLLWLYAGETLVEEVSLRPLRLKLTRKGWAAVVIAVCTGSAGVYFAFFAAVFLGVVAVHRALSARRVTAAFSALAIAAILSVTLLVNISPSFVYRLKHGRNPAVANRSPAEADMYSLKIAQLVLPIHNHRVPQIAALKQRYLSTNAAAVASNDITVSLGIIGAAGFLLLIAAAIIPAIGQWAPGLRPLSMLNLVGLLLGTIGGFGSLFAYIVTPDIRCYYRICVYLALFSFTAALIAVQHILSRIESPGRRSAAFATAGIIMGLGVFDLTPSFANTRETIKSTYLTHESFIQQIERSVPPGSAIFQLPYHPFLEYGFSHQMTDYDHLRGYLLSNTLRWSYGAVKGRADDLWQKAVSSKPVPEMAQLLREKKFAGIYRDTFGYANGADDLRAQLERIAGPPVVSGDQRLLFFNLSNPVGVQTAAPPPSTSIVSVSVSGCSDPEGTPALSWYWCGRSGEVILQNLSKSDVATRVSMLLKTGKGGQAPATVEGLGLKQVLTLSGDPARFSFDVTAPPGVSRFRITCDAEPLVAPGDPRTLTFAVMNIRSTPK